MTKKNRIIINALSLRGGGGQTHLIKIIEYLEKVRDFSVTILVSSQSNLKIQRDDLEIIRVNWSVDNPILRSFWEIFFLPSLIKKLNADLLFCPGGVLITTIPKGVKSATMFRNMTPFDEEQLRKMQFNLSKVRNLILKRVMIRSMQKADLVIFISEFARETILKNLVKPLKESVLIHHGVDFSSNKGDKDIKHIIKTPYILYPSSIDNYKSQLEVVKAYSLLSKKIKLPNLLLVGSINQNPNYVDILRKTISEKKLEEKVLIAGKVDYELMPSLYKQANFIIFASQTENCPNILLEAMSSGKLILCSNLQPMPEFARESVIYFDPKKPEDLVSKIEMVFKNEELIEQYSKKSFIEAERFSWIETSSKTWQSLNSILN